MTGRSTGTIASVENRSIRLLLLEKERNVEDSGDGEDDLPYMRESLPL